MSLDIRLCSSVDIKYTQKLQFTSNRQDPVEDGINYLSDKGFLSMTSVGICAQKYFIRLPE